MGEGIYLLSLFVFFIGASVGSFLNVCIYRIPLKKSIVYPPSSCPKCNGPIAPYDNIPVIGYILLLGRCRGCKARISPIYPSIEILTGLMALALFFKFGLVTDFVVYFVFVSALITSAFIDLEYKILPNVITMPGVIVGLLASFMTTSTVAPLPLEALTGALLGGGLLFLVAYGYHLLTGKEGMGGGDIKLLSMIGAFLGWQGVLMTVFLASLSGSLIGSAFLILKGKGSSHLIPFGPFLVGGAFIYLFFGPAIIDWYMTAMWHLGEGVR